METQARGREVISHQAKNVEFSGFTNNLLKGWKTVMGEKYGMVTRDYSDQPKYSQIVQREVVRPDGMVEPLTVEKADGTVVQREILYERWGEVDGGRGKVRGERKTFVDSDGEVTVRLEIVDEKDRVLEIYTKGTNKGFYQETTCRLSQITDNPTKPFVANAEKLVAAARELGLPLDYSIFKEKLIGKVIESGVEVNRHLSATYEDLSSDNYRKMEVASYDQYVLGSGRVKAFGLVTPINEDM